MAAVITLESRTQKTRLGWSGRATDPRSNGAGYGLGSLSSQKVTIMAVAEKSRTAETVVTPEMAEAGAEVLRRWDSDREYADDVVREIFAAMAAAQHKRQSHPEVHGQP